MSELAPKRMPSRPRASVERIRDRLAEMAQIGASADGITRLAYSEEERRAHELFARWNEEAGKPCSTDEAGNSIAIWHQGEPFFLFGSHLDTVPRGGAFDGAAGVIAGLETAHLVDEHLRRGVRVVAFAGEEGARFGRPNTGSAAAAGFLDHQESSRLRDSEGTTLAEAAGRLGFRPGSTDPWIGAQVACFFEIHIEQGRQLELGALRLGLVDAIAGSIRLRFEITGRADHSGATPMELRADALAAASEVVLAAERIAKEYRSTVATVGRIQVDPNSVTTVPGRALLWVDIRDVDAEQQRIAGRHLLARARQIGEERQVDVSVELMSEQSPVALDAWPRAIARDECLAQGVPFRVLASGAGHDAAIVARRAPAAMIFVPCLDGVSHAPGERAEPRDLADAATVLAEVVERADALLD
ncbi:MAG: Zn-dependent hydrolase [Actinobacteria bacterium]|nr:MAG: Zn-dependent hydrolase [Actinomycetota bacterium]